MKTFLSFVFISFSILFMGAVLHAQGGEGKLTADPVFEDSGNTIHLINVCASTFPVIISSEPTNAGFGINVWRFREIVNVSTGSLMILPNANTYTTFSSSFGIVLSSDPAGTNFGDSWLTKTQSPIWGVWSAGMMGGNCLPGAGGSEHYFK